MGNYLFTSNFRACKIFYWFLLWGLCLITRAQTPQLWGLTLSGGGAGFGSMIAINEDGSNLGSAYSFGGYVPQGSNPMGNLVQGANGLLYGMTEEGGINNVGVIFSYDVNTSTYTNLYCFAGGDSSGASPSGTLIQASNGLLYGMAREGGSNNDGVIFSFDPFTSTYTNLYSFTGAGGANPYGDLLQGSDGFLYGMTPSGGAFSAGVIFSYNPVTGLFTDLYNFTGGSVGAYPQGNLIQTSNGLLYGMAEDGGSNNDGVIFSFNPNTLTYNTVYNFAGGNNSGAYPEGNLILASNGLLYGMTPGGGRDSAGVIFSYNPSTAIYNNLYSFGGDTSNGAEPRGSLLQASNGLLYGMTYAGGGSFHLFPGPEGLGVIFSFNPATSTYNGLYNFENGNLGNFPMGTFIQASNGLLYAMLDIGACNNGEDFGLIFSFDTANGSVTNQYCFGSTSAKGIAPTGNLIQGSNGLLYGMTSKGGANGYGVIFNYNLSTNLYDAQYSFVDNDTLALNPVGSLVQASNGSLYGVTRSGGHSNSGAIFSFNPTTWSFNNCHSFPFGSIALENLTGNLIQASNGSLYGLTGSNFFNTSCEVYIYSYNPSTATYTNLYSFNDTVPNGAAPIYGIMQASNGLLYGMLSAGGSNNNGFIFSFNPSTNAYNQLYSFKNDSSSGGAPYGSLFQAANGLLYGMTSTGGTNNDGVIFSWNINTNTYTTLYNFKNNASSGGNPGGSFIQASDSLLYGTASVGGSNNDGVIFSFNPTGNTYTNLASLRAPLGSNPGGSLLLLSSGATAISLSDVDVSVCPRESLSIPFNAIGSFNVGNTFTATLGYGQTDTIGMLASTTSGTINAVIPSNTAPGNYYLYITSSSPALTNNNINPVIVTVNPPTIAIAGNSQTICHSQSLVPLTGANAVNYNKVLWSSNGTGNFINPDSLNASYIPSQTDWNNGSVTLSLIGMGLCGNDTSSKIITLAPLPVATITNNGVTTFCQNDSIILTANAGNTYLWNSGDTTAAITVKSSGSYYVTETNAYGCSAQSDTVLIVVNGIPAAHLSYTGSNTFCSTDSLILYANTGLDINYQWLDSGQDVGTNETSFTVKQTGSYSVIETDSLGCSAQSDMVIATVNAVSDAAITPTGDTSFCQGDSVILKANTGTGLTYQWKLNGQNISGATLAFYDAKQAGAYQLYEFSSGCGASTLATVNLSINPLPALGVSTNSPVCVGATIHLNATATGGSGTYSNYTWSTPDSFNLGNTTNPARSNARLPMSGPYSVTVTDSKGCTAFDAVSFKVDSLTDSLSTTNAGSPTSLGYITVYAFGVPPYTYNWNTGDNTATIQEPVGEYFVSISDGAGCVDVDSGFIGVSDITDVMGNGWVKIYPNPAEDILYIKISNVIDAEIKIWEITGETVASLESQEQIETIDISNLAEGEYVISIVDKNSGAMKYLKFAKI